MKHIIRLFAITIATSISPFSLAQPETKPLLPAISKKMVAPNGGRIITALEPNIEFLVAADRKVKVTILDKNGKATPVTEQSLSAVCGDRMNPTKLTFTLKDGALISDLPVPEGQSHPVILKFKGTKDSSYKSVKFTLNLDKCGSCSFPEYACVCGCEEH